MGVGKSKESIRRGLAGKQASNEKESGYANGEQVDSQSTLDPKSKIYQYYHEHFLERSFLTEEEAQRICS